MGFKKKRKVSDKKIWSVYSRGCDGKRDFISYEEAELAADEMWDEQRVDLSPYRCKACGKWHLGNCRD